MEHKLGSRFVVFESYVLNTVCKKEIELWLDLEDESKDQEKEDLL